MTKRSRWALHRLRICLAEHQERTGKSLCRRLGAFSIDDGDPSSPSQTRHEPDELSGASSLTRATIGPDQPSSKNGGGQIGRIGRPDDAPIARPAHPSGPEKRA